MFYILGALLFAAGLVPVVTTTIEKSQLEHNSEILKNRGEKSINGKQSVVIYFSRSGNTAVMANRIAEITDAHLINLEAPDYEIGIKGWTNAMLDARGHEAKISPSIVDLSNYETVFLGSPIWLYSPAPPLWSFIKKNNFKGKKVVLFNTYNSKFKQSFIDEFGEIVKSRGAISFDHCRIPHTLTGPIPHIWTT